MKKTKYILVGGYLHKASDEGRAFCEELVKGFNFDRPVKILDCLFADTEERWEVKFKEDKERFKKYIKNFNFELADPKKFIEQVKASDVIFLRGGETERLINVLNKRGDWIKELDGKVLAGTSAGGDVISKYSYNLDTNKIIDCLGLLPVKFIPHWCSDYNAPNIDWDKALQELKNYKENLPIYTLKEGEFVVIEA